MPKKQAREEKRNKKTANLYFRFAGLLKPVTWDVNVRLGAALRKTRTVSVDGGGAHKVCSQTCLHFVTEPLVPAFQLRFLLQRLD